jgi:hypothetical protein
MRLLCCLLVAAASYGAPTAEVSFADAQKFLQTYCKACHTGKSNAGGFRIEQVAAQPTLREAAEKWTSVAARVRNHEMPPRGSPIPALGLRESFTDWVDQALQQEACTAGMKPGPAQTRRLNRDEYAATLRDLLDIHLDIASGLPADGAGGEGFDNAGETLFLSPLHAEKYLDVAKFAVDFAAKEYKSRTKILIAFPGPDLSEKDAAKRILEAFLPRAFRHPVDGSAVARYLELFKAGKANGKTFEEAVFFTVAGVLVSPEFLFHIEPPNPGATARPLDPYSLANRLSYFLWGSMPDELLFDVAAAGKLNDPDVMRVMVRRMLDHDRSLTFAQRFIEQWLGTRLLAGDKAPDEKLFPEYAKDEELRSDIRFQPILFFREILKRDESLLNLIDSTHTIGTSNLAKHYKVEMTLQANGKKQPYWGVLPEGSSRGGLLGMAAVLAVSSYPYRTSPVLRGAWVLESMLGTPPPPPPPNVPALDEAHSGTAPKSMRERLEQHRANPACASCHDRIDPIGFALENYDVLGRWREQDSGKPVDNTGTLIDGTSFQGPDGLKKLLLERKDLFIRHLTSKMLGYALGRGLTLDDSCTVNAIVAHLRENDYRPQALVEAIVMSVPFQQQAPDRRLPVPRKEATEKR